MKKVVPIAFMVAAITGCASNNRIGDFTVASTKNMDVQDSTHIVDSKIRLTGKDETKSFLFIPTGMPNMKEAMDNAIEASNGAAVGLSNVTVKFNTFHIPYLYRTYSYEIEGNPIFEK